ncbi:MutS-related protein [Janthinobacterium fluminis]|uniref:DNA mismatch repair protein MutS n=1 Tax=Janthinobacterium fluminis TaxID=2987524 RepID=A0ABT5KAF6_9BURK|nr:DNA mismatch repair protein MutS [Janthinobacterium fluminis]MDC8760812.1 DNA mismatch repair protein MutS [Janthinobacterium fluminis]
MSQFKQWQSHWRALFERLCVLLAPAAAEPGHYPFARSDVAMFHRVAGGAGVALDDATWDDMLLDQYTDRLAPGTSIFGRQLLYSRLRQGAPDDDGAARLRALLQDPDAVALLEQACAGLRHADTEVSVLLFAEAVPRAPAWSRQLFLLPLALALASAAALLLSWMVWPAAVLLWLVLMGVQSHFHDSAKEWQRTMNALQRQLHAHSLLARLDVAPARPLRDAGARAAAIGRAIGRSPLGQLPVLGDYRDWVLLDNIKHYFKSRELVRSNLDLLRDSYLLVAKLEADLALLRHLRDGGGFCWATRGAPGHLAFTGMVHPLLERAAPLSFALDGKGAFISGQNGIGKSTLLRSVGLNLIVARAFGFCYADAASVPMTPVYSSMQGEDSLAGGESLYLAELRRAKELLALADGPQPAVFIIDEIFRGTNHLESISAAAAVLHTLAARGTVLVSSHNLVLAPLLADCLAPLCVSAPDGAAAGLALAPGVLARPNGIALLAARGFGAPIEAKARRVHDWLSAYLAHPGECADVL